MRAILSPFLLPQPAQTNSPILRSKNHELIEVLLNKFPVLEWTNKKLNDFDKIYLNFSSWFTIKSALGFLHDSLTFHSVTIIRE